MSTTTTYNNPLAPPNTAGAGAGQEEQPQPLPPTQLLGCLRTVGQPTSQTNPLLVAAVFAAGTEANISCVDVKLVDVASGATVARLDRQGNGHFGVTGGLLCLVGTAGHAAVSVLDPATGDVTDVPAYATGDKTSSAFVFGHVPKTGEHKLLRVYTAGHDETTKQTCEILTLRGGKQQHWRPAPSPPVRVGTLLPRHWAVIGGVAHFLIPQRGENDAVASFDLAAEKWRPALLRCPLPSADHRCSSNGLSLVELNGCLVFVHLDYRSGAMDMWVFTTTDLDRPGKWLPVEPLPLGKVLSGARETMVRPLMVLGDGRIAFWVRAPYGWVVRVYNPRNGACLEVVNFGKLCSFVGLYRGSLLGVIN